MSKTRTLIDQVSVSVCDYQQWTVTLQSLKEAYNTFNQQVNSLKKNSSSNRVEILIDSFISCVQEQTQDIIKVIDHFVSEGCQRIVQVQGDLEMLEMEIEQQTKARQVIQLDLEQSNQRLNQLKCGVGQSMSVQELQVGFIQNQIRSQTQQLRQIDVYMELLGVHQDLVRMQISHELLTIIDQHMCGIASHPDGQSFYSVPNQYLKEQINLIKNLAGEIGVRQGPLTNQLTIDSSAKFEQLVGSLTLHQSPRQPTQPSSSSSSARSDCLVESYTSSISSKLDFYVTTQDDTQPLKPRVSNSQIKMGYNHRSKQGLQQCDGYSCINYRN